MHVILYLGEFYKYHLSHEIFAGLNESELAKLEMVTLLCMGDNTHSQLMECMPEKCGSAAQSRDFEAVLSKVWGTCMYHS